MVSVATTNPPTSPPVTQTALRTLRESYIWGPATRQPQLCAFAGQEGPTSAVVAGDSKSPHDYFKLYCTNDLSWYTATNLLFNRISKEISPFQQVFPI